MKNITALTECLKVVTFKDLCNFLDGKSEEKVANPGAESFAKASDGENRTRPRSNSNKDVDLRGPRTQSNGKPGS